MIILFLWSVNVLVINPKPVTYKSLLESLILSAAIYVYSLMSCYMQDPGPLFTNGMDLVTQDIMKPLNH